MSVQRLRYPWLLCSLLLVEVACGGDTGSIADPGVGPGGAAGDTFGVTGTGAAGAAEAAGGTGGAGGGGVDAQGTSGPDGGTAMTGTGGSAGEGGALATGPGPFPPVTDFTAAGPYTPNTLANVGPGSNYTVYYPAEAAPAGAGNPIVAWTSGGTTSHANYTLLPHLAGHGFVVISANTVPNIGQEVALGEEMVAGIGWLIGEHTRAGSEFEGRLDTDHVAASGYSMGSLATFTMAMDDRLTTTLHISGGNMVPERVLNLQRPAAFICGNPGDGACNILSPDCDIAAVNCDTDFDMAAGPVFYANFDGGHLGILTSPTMERINAMSTAWLRFQLMGDASLGGRFVGADCGYCSDADWTVQQKGL